MKPSGSVSIVRFAVAGVVSLLLGLLLTSAGILVPAVSG